jgi:hypothetical protein
MEGEPMASNRRFKRNKQKPQTAVPEFRASTADEVAEQLGEYMREKFASGARTLDSIAMVMRTPAGFVGTAGSRLQLLSQIAETDPEAATETALMTQHRPGYIPIIALDMVEKSKGIEWIGPFPNATGGTA